ncbi:MAG: paraquat-inducible protein A [Gammaproteobacteria bacterium]|nr:paraquat-inducible protein A [Gammaproteobacteria bacterium]
MEKLVACHGCDLLVDVSELEHGARAYCPRCGHFLTRYRHDMMSRVLAFTIAAIILLVVSLNYPFLSFAASGLESVMTLRAAPGALLDYGMTTLAIMVAAFIILIPACILLLLLVISLSVLSGSPNPWLRASTKLVFELETWAMVEVFIIGVIVSLVKIAAMATVVLGIAFWSYAAFTICFTLAMVTLDRYQCWEMIEALETPKSAEATP